MKPYDHRKIEPKWQKAWEREKLYKTSDSSAKPKFYSLIEFPFPSGDGMHTGHLRSNTAMDIVSRKRRMEGYNVLYPIGWDAFGLPTENYAIKTGQHPTVVTKKNTDNFRRQLKSAGFSFDWSREVNTTDPKYYKWTQWIFLQLYENGLAYKKKMLINWCPKDKIGLANEEVVDGCCERCGTPVEKREKEQWMLAITKYADRLDKDLDTVDYLEKIKIQQRNWIGRSEGAEIEFAIKDVSKTIKVFTTRADTLFGVSYIVLAPEHELVKELTEKISNKSEVNAYIQSAKTKTTIDRTDAKKEKTGIELKGVFAINPANNNSIPVWIADYVLADYGTGAVMAVPAHDDRDYEFAKKYKLPIKEVIIPRLVDAHDPPKEGVKVVERKAVQVILRDPANDKILCLRWKKLPWTTFITGGIEGDEDEIEAARREVLEETGYKNIKFIKPVGGKIESHFFANHKGENRKALFSGLLFEIENHEKIEMSEEEKAIHEPVWVTWEEMTADKNIKCSEFETYKDRLFNPPHSFNDYGVLQDSAEFSGLRSEEAKAKIAQKYGKIVTTYKLRDWVFSRQRYWGEPIPMIHCESCGIVPVPEKDLPVKLPNVKNYQPTDNGESPLAAITKWVNVKCPNCKKPAKRETDTMPNWAGSSWYFLRYIDPNNKKVLADPKKLKHMMPVDWYNGGMEHTTLHLLYSRFWNKFLFDIGVAPTSEPYTKRTSHGFILASNGEKMSKSRGNVVNPDEIIGLYGADTLRLYEMFMAPFDQMVAWNTESIIGSRRFLEKVWKLSDKVSKKSPTVATLESSLHKTIKKVSDDIESMQFNTAISSMMIFVNELEKVESVPQSIYATFLSLLAPFAPHITDELWAKLGNKKSIHTTSWPTYDPSKAVDSEIKIVIQINGKTRGEMSVPSDFDDEKIKNMALNMDFSKKWIGEGTVKKVVYVKNRLVNIVV